MWLTMWPGFGMLIVGSCMPHEVSCSSYKLSYYRRELLLVSSKFYVVPQFHFNLDCSRTSSCRNIGNHDRDHDQLCSK